jgi:hydroxyacylglutathione hydrolase
MNEPRLILHQMELGPMQNFVYIIGCERTREAAVVDPAWDVPSILKVIRDHELKVGAILLTHTHFDHINGVEELLKATDARVFVHKKEAAALAYSTSVKKIESGDEVKIGDHRITFVHTPGHTPGSQCFYLPDRLIAGDTLFVRGCGRCDLPGGNPEEMFQSLSGKLKKMDDHVRLYPGHNYAEVPVSTLGEEKKHNPFLLCQTKDQFLRMTSGFI